MPEDTYGPITSLIRPNAAWTESQFFESLDHVCGTGCSYHRLIGLKPTSREILQAYQNACWSA